MLNVHFNGEIVRCPDIVTIQKRLIEQRLAESKCKYNVHELSCPVWRDYCNSKEEIKPLSEFGRCFLSGSELCPQYKFRKDIGNLKKNFSIDEVVYRKVSSAGHCIIKTSEHKTLFITLTFPPFKKHLTNEEANKLFSKFIKNLRYRHGCTGYVAVREFGTKGNRIHFHCIISIPYIPFSYLNCYWCSVIRDYCSFSFNAVQTDPKTKFINESTGAMRYVCKYFSKARGQKSESKLIFISNNLLSKTVYTDIYDKETGEAQTKTVSCIKRSFRSTKDFLTFQDVIDNFKGIEIKKTSDYTTRYRFLVDSEFDQFCNQYLYQLFDINSAGNGLNTG